ncbi:MAG: DegT/DnrJ/EryC1/StrS family aminotransferase [Phycisphaerae bacterium]
MQPVTELQPAPPTAAPRPVRVPLVDLRAAFRPIRQRVLAEFGEILDEMHLLLGPRQQAFEREFADYCGTAHGVAVSNGTDALYLALTACGIGPGDEVITVAHTFFATVAAIVRTGATPVLVDIDAETMTIGPRAAERAITPHTRAIVPVHLNGHPADMRALLEVAQRRNLRLVEDACQAHGARVGHARCGSMSDAAAFSFYVSKNLGALGEAGFVTTSDAAIAESVRRLRHHGHVSKFDHAEVGHNHRMDELQAAVLRIRLETLDAGNQRRRQIAQRYDAHFAGAAVELLRPRESCEPVYHLYPIRVAQRDELREWLAERGIESGIHYRVPAHRQPALRGRPHRCEPLPVTEATVDRLVSLPIHPELRDTDVDYVADCVLEFFRTAAPAPAPRCGQPVGR